MSSANDNKSYRSYGSYPKSRKNNHKHKKVQKSVEKRNEAEIESTFAIQVNAELSKVHLLNEILSKSYEVDNRIDGYDLVFGSFAAKIPDYQQNSFEFLFDSKFSSLYDSCYNSIITKKMI